MTATIIDHEIRNLRFKIKLPLTIKVLYNEETQSTRETLWETFKLSG